MSIVTVSRGTYSKGKEIAERLAERLGYEPVGREILLEASDEFNIPEVKLARALHDSPSVLDRFTHGKQRYIAFIRCAVLDRLRKDNVVYHGLAGHFFLTGISHVMKVRIIADLQDRVKEETRRENLSEQEARYRLQQDDQERRKWSLHLYGIDTSDPMLYDIVLHVGKLTVPDVVDILADAAARPCFRTTEASQNAMQDLYLAAAAQARLVEQFPTVRAVCKDRVLYVTVKSHLAQTTGLEQQIRDVLAGLEDIRAVRTVIEPAVMPD
jgi:cytidylate kinase